MVKTRKIKLIAVGETASDRTNVYKHIKEVASVLAEMGNEIIRLHVCNQYEIYELKKQKISASEAVRIVSERLGTSIQNSGYRLTTNYSKISSEIRTGFNQNLYKTITENFYDIVNGKMSIPSLRKTNICVPFSPIRNENGGTDVIYLDDERYCFDFPISVDERKLKKEIKLSLFFGKDRSNNRIIVDRVISGEYSLCGSSIQVKDNDLYMLLTYRQPVATKEITEEKMMGVDIGINRPVAFYIENEKHQPSQVEIGLKIQHDRIKFSKQRQSIQKSIKYSKGGHGRNKKTQAIEQFREKEMNWAKNVNHKISSELIKVAQDYKVTKIKIEDLTGITKNAKDYFLKSWGYFQLQTFIQYKAQQVGIKIEFVNPKDTSRKCSSCGNIDIDARDKNDLTKYSCTNPECKDFNKIVDADINAAKNITFTKGTEVKEKSKAGKKKKAQEKKITTGVALPKTNQVEP